MNLNGTQGCESNTQKVIQVLVYRPHHFCIRSAQGVLARMKKKNKCVSLSVIEPIPVIPPTINKIKEHELST